ncbi:regulatory protein RecX [Rhodococcus sp. H29-C3]|uniref:regulatory protein RecX n=1 Tax=Rhodococcus sp. H29-C3 TaxID=3046307 RepID=UPI0024BB57B4|nr:regulatory protein RecX [Rhodococcus sp. H29-C3]MDJ0361440.1 regulatory protein RecX [Rhodococcus sp. H29-C3]
MKQRSEQEQETDGGGTEAQAKDVCLRLLTDRARSRHELETRLSKKGFSPEVADAVLKRLEAANLVDDQAFAEQWVHSRHTYSGKGKRALSVELRAKGVSNEDALNALDQIDTEDERVRATELVHKRCRNLTVPDGSGAEARAERDKIARKLVGMLARRGYSAGMAYAIVKAELARIGTEDSNADHFDTQDFDGDEFG